jgi:hypothetical protein
LRFIIGLILSAILQAGTVIAASKNDTLLPEHLRLFVWFDQLGIEEITKAKLVRVRTGKVAYVGNEEKRHPDEPRAFLVSQDGNEFRVVLGDLTAATFKHAGKGPKDDQYVGWREVSIHAEATALLRVLAKKEIDSFWDDGHDIYSDRLDVRAQAFVLARYCAAKGHEAVAARLMRAAADKLEATTPERFEEELQDEFGFLLRWRAAIAFADASLSRKRLAQLYRSIVENCPGLFRSEVFVQLAETLEEMAAEDERHKQFSSKQFDQLPAADKARELVFHLRDERIATQDMWPRPWPFEPTAGNGAVEKLKALGFPAVPALLEALRDSRPTRSVVRSHRYGGGAWPQEIRDLASEALNGIAGVNLFWLVPDFGMLPRAAGWEKMIEIAEDWWKTVQTKGELEWLRAHAVGDTGAHYCLDALARRYPEHFVEAALKSVSEPGDPRSRSEVVKRLSKVEAPETDAFLLRELENGPTLLNRVTAACALQKRQRTAAMQAMLAEWRKLADGGDAPAVQADAKSNWDYFDPESGLPLLEFLLDSDAPEGARAIEETWGRLPTAARERAVDLSRVRWFQDGTEISEVDPATPGTRAALERLLIVAVADDTLVSASYPGIVNPSIAELAASVLAQCHPDKYKFTLKSSKKSRAVQLAKVRRTAAGARSRGGAADNGSRP